MSSEKTAKGSVVKGLNGFNFQTTQRFVGFDVTLHVSVLRSPL